LSNNLPVRTSTSPRTAGTTTKKQGKKDTVV